MSTYSLLFIAQQLNALQYRRMDFEEFCAAALSVHQLEALDRWEQHARCAYELFDKDGNRAIVIEELASVSWNQMEKIHSWHLLHNFFGFFAYLNEYPNRIE